MFPRVMISSIADANSLTIYSAASGSYTLKVMTYATFILLPFVLAYQGWSYTSSVNELNQRMSWNTNETEKRTANLPRKSYVTCVFKHINHFGVNDDYCPSYFFSSGNHSFI